MSKVAVITGGSSGIGKATAALFARQGYIVYELSRSGKEQSGVRHLDADVTREESLIGAMRLIGEENGRIDLLVNNAGMGISGAIEFTETESARRIFDVNFFGTFCSIKAALPYLRKSDAPRIINLSSVAAPLSIPFQAFYSATKAAINSLTLALANELRPWRFRVSAVMPGDVHTGFTAAREKSAAGEELYGAAMEKAVGSMEKDELSGMTPDYIAALIYRVANKKRPKVLYTAGGKYKFFVFLSKVVPANLINKLVGAVY